MAPCHLLARRSPRTSDDFGKLLNDSAVPTTRRYRTIAETFDLKQPLPPGSDGSTKPNHGGELARTALPDSVPLSKTIQTQADTPEGEHIEQPAGDNEMPVFGPGNKACRSRYR